MEIWVKSVGQMQLCPYLTVEEMQISFELNANFYFFAFFFLFVISSEKTNFHELFFLMSAGHCFGI